MVLPNVFGPPTMVATVVDFKNRDSAVPGGYKASAEEDKTLTSALVSLLGATERGIPLGELKERLRKEQKKQKSRNFPDVKGSLSFGLVQGLFPV